MRSLLYSSVVSESPAVYGDSVCRHACPFGVSNRGNVERHHPLALEGTSVVGWAHHLVDEASVILVEVFTEAGECVRQVGAAAESTVVLGKQYSRVHVCPVLRGIEWVRR